MEKRNQGAEENKIRMTRNIFNEQIYSLYSSWQVLIAVYQDKFGQLCLVF